MQNFKNLILVFLLSYIWIINKPEKISEECCDEQHSERRKGGKTFKPKCFQIQNEHLQEVQIKKSNK